MPSTPTQKTPENKKSFCNQVNDAESEKVDFGDADLVSVDNTSHSAGGAGETPVKKSLKKSTKVEDDKTGKKTNSTIVDKVPKKNAQRTKGSISLNKTIEKTNAELSEKKQRGFDSSVSISATKEEGQVENSKGGTDGRRTPVSVRNKGSKTKTATKKSVKKDSKDSKSKVQKPWVDAVEKLSNNTLEKKNTAEATAKENFTEIQSSEIRPLNPPFATCSFFEKLQQGVKSYFGSKNSFTSYDKNKKDGGSQNSASIANGVKEDAKKRKPGLILKNDIYNSESDLSHDELRSNSSLGGQSNNFSNDKPKIFRKLKHKKFYNPKKHYVGIQIPRKGYFYRSTIQFKTPGSPESGQFERLEPHDVTKSKSKIQISRLASTSSKISNLSNKKRLKSKQGNSEEGSSLGSAVSGDCLSFESLERPSSPFRDEKSGYGFEQKFNNYLALHWPNRNLHSREKKKLRLKDDKILEYLNPELEGGKQMSAVSEKLLRSDSQKTMGRRKKKSLSVGNNFSEILDITSERVLPTFKKQKRTPESTFESLFNTINSTLGNDKLFHDLEITQIKDMTKEPAVPCSLQDSTETPPQFTEIINAFDNFNSNCEKPIKSETLCLSPVSPSTFYRSDNKSIASLMEEIDLHLELQNYLKEYNNITKNQVKITQENNISGNVDCPNEKNKFSGIRESKSSSSFASATSNCSVVDESGNQFRVFLDCKCDMMSLSEECMGARLPKTFNLRTKLTDESSEIRKIKSENSPRTLAKDSKLNSSIKRTFGKTSFHMLLLDDNESLIPRHLSSVSTEDSVDSYEKITPFEISSNKNCNSTRTRARNKSRILFENLVYSLSAESVAQRVWKVASDKNSFETEASKNFKKTESVRSTSHKESPNSEMTLPTDPQRLSNTSKWSPTLQDLIDIYNSILKQNRKIRRNSRNSVNNCSSSHLFTFLNKKLQEKQLKANLMKLSKDFSSSCRSQKPWKLFKEKEDSIRLKEYVAMFQEILQSSLSINQITRLNNIISNLQDYSEKNYDFFKDLKRAADAKSEMKKNVPVIEQLESASKMDVIHQTEPVSETKPKACFLKESVNETPKASNLSNELNGIRGRKTKKPKLEKLKTKSKEEAHEIELSSSKALEHLLKTSFDSVDVVREGPEKAKMKNKLLVTVKVSGNRILVNDLTYLNNEDELSSQRTKQEGTSELIIENITRHQVGGSLHKNLKIDRPKYLGSFQAEKTSNKSDVKLKKGKLSKPRKSQKQTQAKVKEIPSDINSEAEYYPQEQSRPSETVFPFEYDQMQLRAQHPIEAIIESPESKMSEIFDNSDKDKSKTLSELSSGTKILLKDIHNDSAVLKEALKDALAENVFSKDLICNFDWSEEEIGKTLGPVKSYVIRPQTAKRRSSPLTKKKQIPETVRSMVDLNSKTCRKRKDQKVLPARLQSTYLCYPLLQNFQARNLKLIQKSKEKIKDKKLALTSPTPSAKSTTQQVMKPDIRQNVSQDLGLKRKKSEAFAINSQTPDSTAAAARTNPSDCCNIEFLLSEDTKKSFALSVSGQSTKQDLSVPTASEQFSRQDQMSPPNSSHSPEAALKKGKDSPTMLHSPRYNIEDLSFSSMIIHSDSFLKCFSGFALTRSKLESLFKSNSDMKFYPGRISKRGSEPNPIVTFVLTPKQKKLAVHSSDKIHVITKPGAVKSSAVASILVPPSVVDGYREEKKTVEVKPSISSDEISFQSLENFNELSKHPKKAMTLKILTENTCKKNQKKLKQSSSSCNRKKKCLTSSQTSPSVDLADRKAYHECQKKKKVSAGIDAEVKKTAKTSSKMKESQMKKIKIMEKKEKFQNSRLLFPNKIKDFIKALEILEKNSIVENKESKKCEKKEKDITTGIVNFTKKYSKNIIDDVKNTVIPKSNVTDINTEAATKTTANKNSTKKSQNSSNFLPELLDMLKTTLKQTEDFKNKAEIISIIEKELDKKRSKLWEEAVVTCESSGDSPSSPRKLKTVKIKIYCSERKCSAEGKKVKNFSQNPQTEKIRLLEEIRSAQFSPHKQVMGEDNILNSIVWEEETKGEDLERQNSTYFDALEKTLSDETGGAGEEIGDSQKIYHRPLEGILDLNAEFGVKEMKSRFHPFLTPSDEKLLLAKESEEAIFIKIMNSLKEDKISYSLALLEEFLKKIENSPDDKGTCFKLRQMLLLIEDKRRNLMMSMEKKAWFKVLSLLEEISQIFEGEDIESSMTNHLQMTKAFINKFQALNMSRLVDLQNFCYTLSQQPISKNDGNHVGKIFRKMCETLNFLKQKFTLKRNCTCRETEKFRGYENKNQESESRFKRHSTVSLPEICEKINRSKEKNQLECLKRKIKQQKMCIEQLMEHNSKTDSVPQGIEDVKNKVAEKLKWLEKMLGLYNLGENSKETTTWSLLEEIKTCTKRGTGR